MDQIQIEIHGVTPKPIFRRSLGVKKRCSVDGIDTHCGFVFRETSSWHYARQVSLACDRAMAKRGMIWVNQLQDYLAPRIA